MIRRAKKEDLLDLLDIYNDEVLNGVATFDLDAKTIEEWTEWFNSHQNTLYPLFVYEEEGKCLGYASFSPYRQKEAFISTVELSIYISKEARGKKIASKLIEYMKDYAKNEAKIHMIISVITAGNDASVHLHEKYGFDYAGTIREAGFKFGAYRDIVNYTYIIKRD